MKPRNPLKALANLSPHPPAVIDEEGRRRVPDAEHAAALWLQQIKQGALSAKYLAQFNTWLADPRNELAVARLVVAELDEQLFRSGGGDFEA